MPPHKSERDLLDQSYSSLVASVVGDLIHEVVDEMSAMLSREAVGIIEPVRMKPSFCSAGA